MKWSSAVSENPSLAEAVAEAAADLREQLGDETPDLTAVFVSAHHASEYDRVPELVSGYVGDGALVGCSGGGVIGAGTEVENRPGFAITAASLPDVELASFHVENGDLPDADAPPDRWESLVKANGDSEPHFVLLADPWSIDAESMVRGLDYAFPGSVKIGGMASGAQGPGGNALFLSNDVHSSGAVGVAMHGAVQVDTIVAQGCRPIGELMQVTSCHQNVLLQLDGHSAMETVSRLVQDLGDRDRELARHSLFLGVVMDPLNDSPQLGDFLIRNIIGADQQSGALAIGETLREGQTVQFQLRDAETSAADLDELLERYAIEHPTYEDTGALLFSCLGRGEHLYGRPDHDTEMFRRKVSPMPLTGFFCNGEIGPVGDATYVHGYTSSFGVFRPKHH